MKALNLLLTVVFFLGMSTFMKAEVVSGDYPTNPPVEVSDNELPLSVVMMDQEKVFVQWQSKVKGIYFEIEHSIDGENYEMIATSEDVVASSDGTVFQFIDESPTLENYYRIFFITPSGTVDYSDVIFISPLPSNMTIDGLK